MGIRNLHRFLAKNAPSIYHEINVSEFKNKTIAVDTNLYLFHFKNKHKQKWLSAFYHMITLFRKHSINLVFVYDTRAPIEKEVKQKERKCRRRNAENRISAIRQSINDYENNHGLSPLLEDIMDKQCDRVKQLLRPREPVLDYAAVYNEIDHLQNQIVNVYRSDVQLSKDMLTLLNIPFYDSLNEAETMCSYFCCHGKVDAVLSNDTDVMVYGTPIFLTRFVPGKEMFTRINIDEVLSELQLTQTQFVDLCIMSGTDYNKNIPRIGSEKAYKLLSSWTSIEDIAINTQYDISILNHVRIREIYSFPNNPPEPEVYTFDSVGDAIVNDFAVFAAQNNLKFDREQFIKYFGYLHLQCL
jgi:5'-3' exonuclease